MAEQKKLLINNDWRDAAGGKRMDVVNPATEEVIATVASAEASDVDAAVAAARAALNGPWARCRRASADGSSAGSPIG